MSVSPRQRAEVPGSRSHRLPISSAFTLLTSLLTGVEISFKKNCIPCQEGNFSVGPKLMDTSIGVACCNAHAFDPCLKWWSPFAR